jgi:hypothetical protein
VLLQLCVHFRIVLYRNSVHAAGFSRAIPKISAPRQVREMCDPGMLREAFYHRAIILLRRIAARHAG